MVTIILKMRKTEAQRPEVAQGFVVKWQARTEGNFYEKQQVVTRCRMTFGQ